MKIYKVKLVEDKSFVVMERGKGHDDNNCNSPEKFADILRPLFEEFPGQEQMRVALLNRKNKPIGFVLCTVGTATSSIAHPREIFRAAIVAGASGIIILHNHPSGDCEPSSADLAVTRQLKNAAQIIGIDLIDHIIVGEKESDSLGQGYYSFREKGLV